MKNDILIVAYLAVMGGTIIAVDVLFLRNHFWWRLGVNVGIVVTFALIYFLFLRRLLE